MVYPAQYIGKNDIMSRPSWASLADFGKEQPMVVIPMTLYELLSLVFTVVLIVVTYLNFKSNKKK